MTLQGVSAGGAAVNNAQLDILFDTNVFYIPSDARRACQVSPSLAHLVHTETLPASPPSPPGMQRLRLNVIDTIEPLGEITEGDFYFCVLEVREDAAGGATTLTATRQNIGDTVGNVLSSSVTSGVVIVQGGGGGGANAFEPRAGGGGGAPGAAGLNIPAPGAVPGQGGTADDNTDPSNAGGSSVGSSGASAGGGRVPGLGVTPTGEEGRDSGSGMGADRRDAAAEGRGNTIAGSGGPLGQPSVVAAVGTPSPKPTEAGGPRATATKGLTPTRKVEATKTMEPTPEEKASGCAMDPNGSSWSVQIQVILGLTAWRMRRSRRTPRQTTTGRRYK